MPKQNPATAGSLEELDISVAHPARMHNYVLGGKDHFLFTGLELLEPGAVLVSEWRRDIPGPRPLPAEINFYGAVARKPL